MATQNLADKYSPKVAERFSHKAYSAGIASDAYDFDGVKSINVYSVDTVPLGTYSKAVNGFTGSRYGTPVDLTDSYQTMTLNQDKTFTYIIDKGDDKNQLNIKKANRSLTRELDERVTPYLDKYNFARWIACAGQAVIASTTISATNALSLVQDATEMLDEMACPDSGRTLVVTNNFFKLLKQNANFVYTDKLATDAMIRGKVGELDGMSIRKVPNSYFPTGVVACVMHSSALLAPMKLKEYKIHVDPPGINGNLVEGRLMHDAFVLDAKANAIIPICASSVSKAAVATAPAISSHALTVTISGGNVDYVLYTLDGSDPRCSGTAVKVTSTTGSITTTSGTTVRSVAHKDGKVLEFVRLADVVDP